jgi:hypothetical protein
MARSSASDILWNLIERIPVFSTACARRGTVQCRGGEIDAKTQEVDVGKIQNVARRRAGRHRETTAARSYGLFLPERPQPADYIIWVRAADNGSSYLFLTDSGLKLIRAVRSKTAAFPEIYKNALVALGKDVDHAR